MAFHRGDVALLEAHLSSDPHLLERRFTLDEIYPLECGWARNGESGMHWTPIGGTTMLHLAIDFRERGIFDWLLAHGADVNARAAVDGDGFGGQTPLFNAVVCSAWHATGMARTLIERGAPRDAQASLRKFLDWIENPHWHEAHNATAAEWGRGFPQQSWVDPEALRLLN